MVESDDGHIVTLRSETDADERHSTAFSAPTFFSKWKLIEKIEQSGQSDIYYRSLKVRNFTCFEDVNLDFVPGINVFVGENGTGKTHLMKLLYSWLLNKTHRKSLTFTATLLEVMQADKEADVVRHGSKEDAHLTSTYGERELNATLLRKQPRGSFARAEALWGDTPNRPVFIPATDMMAHTKKFVSKFDEVGLDFDYTYRDIVHLLTFTRKNPTSQYQSVIDQLDSVLGGKVSYDSDEQRFYLTVNRRKTPIPLVAEGLRKIAMLLVLVRNGSIQPGTTLFWDEPEVNLNPFVMDEVARCLLALADRGVQVFLASHSYVMLKELEVGNVRPDNLKYFAFRPAGVSGVKVKEANSYLEIEPNRIEDQYTELYDRDVRKQIEAVEASNNQD